MLWTEKKFCNQLHGVSARKLVFFIGYQWQPAFFSLQKLYSSNDECVIIVLVTFIYIFIAINIYIFYFFQKQNLLNAKKYVELYMVADHSIVSLMCLLLQCYVKSYTPLYHSYDVPPSVKLK